MAEKLFEDPVAIVRRDGKIADIKFRIDLICQSSNPFDLRMAFRTHGIPTGVDQFCFPLLQPLAQVSPVLRDSLVDEIDPYPPLTRPEIDRYLFGVGFTPSLAMRDAFPRLYPDEFGPACFPAKDFTDRADEVVLQKLKQIFCS